MTEKITWTTDEPSDSGVEYGAQGGVQRFTPPDPTLTKDHTVWLSGLMPNTTYVFRVYSHDAAGNQARSPESTFLTSAYNAAASAMGWFDMLDWCGWASLLLLALFALATGTAVYWHNEAKRLRKKAQKKT
jgi:hypothetical protein